MTISELVRNQPDHQLAKIFGNINPTSTEVIPVRGLRLAKNLSTTPLQAGITAHNLLLRWRDNAPLDLDDSEQVFWAFVIAIRERVRLRTKGGLAVEVPVRWRGCVGRCDIASGDGCIVEMKVVNDPEPSPRHVAQLGAYAAGLKASVAALALIHPTHGKVTLHWYRNVGFLAKRATCLPIHGSN